MTTVEIEVDDDWLNGDIPDTIRLTHTRDDEFAIEYNLVLDSLDGEVVLDA